VLSRIGTGCFFDVRNSFLEPSVVLDDDSLGDVKHFFKLSSLVRTLCTSFSSRALTFFEPCLTYV
jgi:hypothetical protein